MMTLSHHQITLGEGIFGVDAKFDSIVYIRPLWIPGLLHLGCQAHIHQNFNQMDYWATSYYQPPAATMTYHDLLQQLPAATMSYHGLLP